MDTVEREATPGESESHQLPRSGLPHRGSGDAGAVAPRVDDQQVLDDIRAMLKRHRDEVVLNVDRCFKQVVETLLLNRSPSLAAARARCGFEGLGAAPSGSNGNWWNSSDEQFAGPRRSDTSCASGGSAGFELYDGTTPHELDEMLGRVAKSHTEKKATIVEDPRLQSSFLQREGTKSSGLGVNTGPHNRGTVQSFAEDMARARSIRTTQRKLSGIDLELKAAAEAQETPAEIEPRPSLQENMTFQRRALIHARRFAQALVTHTLFESFTFVIIFTNVAIVGIEVDYMATSRAEDTPQTFYTIDCVYTGCFLFELVARIIAEEPSFFYSKNWAWNYFDLMIVGSSVIETIFTILQSSGGLDMSHFRVIRVIRVTRLIRTFRMVRLVRFIRALRTLLYSIMVTMKSLVWALLLLLMIFYGFGVAFTQAVSEHNVGRNYLPKVGDRSCLEVSGICDLVVFWGTLPRAMFTLFKAIAGGVSWHSVVEPLSIVSWVWVAVFVGFIAFTFLAVLNVVTGVFCQSAIESAQQDKDIATMQLMASRNAFVQTIQELFRDIDVDTSGAISIHEFEDFLQQEKFQAYFASLEIDASDVWSLFKLMDSDQTGNIDLEEFIGGCLQLRGQAKAVQIAKMSYDNNLVRKMLVEFMDSVDERLDALIVATGMDAAALDSQLLLEQNRGGPEADPNSPLRLESPIRQASPTSQVSIQSLPSQAAQSVATSMTGAASTRSKASLISLTGSANMTSTGSVGSSRSWRRDAFTALTSRNSWGGSARGSWRGSRMSTSGLRTSTSGPVLKYSSETHKNRDITL